MKGNGLYQKCNENGGCYNELFYYANHPLLEK